jgi:hypothetical protein
MFDPITADALYQSHRWRKLRAAVLAENPTCQCCNRSPATEAHHEVPRRYCRDPFQRGNIVAVCRSCHLKLTRQQRRKYF